MTAFTPDIKDIEFTLKHVANMPQLSQLSCYEDATPDLVSAVLGEAAKLSENVWAPLNKIGDQQGSLLVDGRIKVPEGFVSAFVQYNEGGWMGMCQKLKYGGQGLPFLLHTAASEMFYAANMALALNPMLSGSAIKALCEHGSAEQKNTYLEKLIGGEWTGTMNLTESQAGSDLAAVRSSATPKDDHYLIKGQKIFITWGDHELTENIVHMVLARIPGAPEGVKGTSLFLVPKFLVNADGSLGDRNDVYPTSVEHKMGIHGSPTCVMSFGDNEGAIGYLVGKENHGLAHMFTMMNDARLAVGLEGVAISERAYQAAADYAKNRVQGRAAGIVGSSAIINHPDVRRMLMQMRSLTQAARCITLVAAATQDIAENTDCEEQSVAAQQRLDLLVPITKGWSTEVAQEVTYLGVQIHGGMGFIEETGAAQHYRDARITTIYEGTTGIQALDLIGRKMIRDGGAAINSLLAEISAFVAELDDRNPQLNMLKTELQTAVNSANDLVSWVLNTAAKDSEAAGSGSVNLLMSLGNLLGAYLLSKSAVAATKEMAQDSAYMSAKIATAVYFAQHVLPRNSGLRKSIIQGTDAVMSIPADMF